MKREIISITSNYDNLELHASVTIPDIKPLAIVQIMPPLMESRYFYDDLAAVLASYGYVVLTADYRGHGQSINGEHPLGYFAENDGWIKNIKDQNMFCQWIRERYRHLNYYLFAAGFGTYVALSYLKRYEYEVSAMVLANVPSEIKWLSLYKPFIEQNIKSQGSKAPCKPFTDKVFRNLEKKHKCSLNSWLSDDQNIVDRYNTDALCGFDLPNQAVLDLLFGQQDIFVNKDWQVLKKELPILLLNGQKDLLTHYPEGLKQISNRLNKVGYQNLESKVYPEFKADLVNGNNKNVVYEDLILWYNKINK